MNASGKRDRHSAVQPAYVGWRSELLAKLALSRIPSLAIVHVSQDHGYDYVVTSDDGLTFCLVVRARSSLHDEIREIHALEFVDVDLPRGLLERARTSLCPVVLFFFDADSGHGRYLRLDTLAEQQLAKQYVSLPIDHTITTRSLNRMLQTLRTDGMAAVSARAVVQRRGPSSPVAKAVEVGGQRRSRLRVRRLEMRGFKSFADRTVFEFADGISGIVGPEGCGKTNIVDAIKWALGEQRPRAVRCSKMLDVIFDGAKERRPVGMAEVSLALDVPARPTGLDSTVVEIARRLYRDGTSEYLLNRRRCRLRDVRKIARDAGLEAGFVGTISEIETLLIGGQDVRRSVLEEAAGLRRLTQSRQKLRRAQEMLKSLSDVRKLNERHCRSLKRRADRARHHRTLCEDLVSREALLKDALQRQAPQSIRGDEGAAEDPVSIDLLTTQVEALRTELERLGRVELDAIPELEAAKTHLRFIRSQERDLLRSVDSLEKAIRAVGTASSEHFAELFLQIRENFRDMFRRLFGGGKADVFLDEGMDVMGGGVEIVARPPGKELRSLSLLSGRERVLTAVAFLLAVLIARSSPFVILDEVDRAVDEEDIPRLMSVVRGLTDQIQFVMITHRHAALGEADVVHGVTMPEPGVSRKIAVNLAADLDDRAPAQSGGGAA